MYTISPANNASFCVYIYKNCVSSYLTGCDVISIADQCDTGSIQLSPLSSNNNDMYGRLEVCYNGYWGSVCDDYADDMVADVVCRQLGHSEG